jgi:shikimate kinase
MKLAGPIIITGFMGCGKTEVARALARRLDLEAIDLDDKIAAKHGRTAAELIVVEGEAAFRAIETNTLREFLQTTTPNVIALGGGAWITEENRELIAAHRGVAVLLDTPFAVCWQRIEASAEDRPLGRTREQAEQLYRQRRPIYQLAQLHIPVMDQESIDSTVARIETGLANYHDVN